MFRSQTAPQNVPVQRCSRRLPSMPRRIAALVAERAERDSSDAALVEGRTGHTITWAPSRGKSAAGPGAAMLPGGRCCSGRSGRSSSSRPTSACSPPAPSCSRWLTMRRRPMCCRGGRLRYRRPRSGWLGRAGHRRPQNLRYDRHAKGVPLGERASCTPPVSWPVTTGSLPGTRLQPAAALPHQRPGGRGAGRPRVGATLAVDDRSTARGSGT